MSATSARPLAFVDVETTGLDPHVHAIIEVAVIKAIPETLSIIDRFESKILPPPDAAFDPDAARMNGFTPEGWAAAPHALNVLPRLAAMFGGCIVAGHNPAFDWAFLTSAFRRAGLPVPAVDHHLLDTASLAWPLFHKGRIPSLSLRDLCTYFRLPNDGAHRAMRDAERAVHVYRRLMEAMP